MRNGKRRQGGFTYLGLIVFVFIIGLVGAATLKVEALLRRAQLERELLDTGMQFGLALDSYAAATPRGQPRAPMRLEDLLRDQRFPNPRRHLRKLFIDPVTGKAEWGLVRAGEAGPILGVHSLSQATPLKQANFEPYFAGFENREHLAEWKFMAKETGTQVPPVVAGQPLVPPATPPPPQPTTLDPEPPQDEPPEAPPPEPSTPPGQDQDSGS